MWLYGTHAHPQLDAAALSHADLRKANLRGAGFRGARLDGADLRDARLGSAFLVGASLRGADLRGYALRGQDLSGVNLERADLRGADLRGAIGYKQPGTRIEGALLDMPTQKRTAGQKPTEANTVGSAPDEGAQGSATRSLAEDRVDSLAEYIEHLLQEFSVDPTKKAEGFNRLSLIPFEVNHRILEVLRVDGTAVGAQRGDRMLLGVGRLERLGQVDLGHRLHRSAN